MARGINKVILLGRCGQEPESRVVGSGSTMTRISIATSDSWKDKQTGMQQERTEWHRVVFFGRLAEIAAQYMAKGRQVYIEGAIRTRKWDDQQGQSHYTTEVIASELQLLGGREQGNTAPAEAPQRGDYLPTTASRPPQAQAPVPAATTSPSRPAANDFEPFDSLEDDEIPF